MAYVRAVPLVQSPRAETVVRVDGSPFLAHRARVGGGVWRPVWTGDVHGAYVMELVDARVVMQRLVRHRPWLRGRLEACCPHSGLVYLRA